MGIFGTKKKKDSEAEDTEEQDQQSATEASRGSGRKKIKATERLDSVISESVTSSALELLRKNPEFQLSPQAWVVLVVPSEALGGLGKKHSSDEAKGSIIEHIEQDQIQVLASASMLAEEHFGIIPTADSLQVMQEYSLLTEAKYYWSLVQVDDDNTLDVQPWAEGGAHLGGGDGGYKEAVEISNGNLHISAVLPELWEWAAEEREEENGTSFTPEPVRDEDDATGVIPAQSGFDEEEDDDPMSGAAAPAASAVEDEGVDYDQLNAQDEGSGFDDDDAELFEDEFVPAEPSAPQSQSDLDPDDVEEDQDDDEDEYRNYLEVNEGRVVKDEEVKATIARRFLSDELTLDIDLDEFNTIFDVEAPTIEFPVAHDTTDWLGSQVNQVVSQANAELARLHRDHGDELRETYVHLMGAHTEAVLDQVSLKKGDTLYGQMNNAAEAEYDQATKSLEEQAAIQRREITERFEARLNERAQQAAANARVEYHNRHQPQHEQNLAEVGVALQRRNEERREARRRDILTWREAEARKLMDLGSNKALKIISERQTEQRETEMQMMRDWSDEITRLIDANRNNDVARANALQSQLDKDNRVEEIRQEQARRVAEVEEERNRAIERLREDLAETHRQNERTLATRERELQALIASERTRSEAAEATVQSLNKQIDKVESRNNKSHREEVQRLESSLKTKNKELDRAIDGNKRTVLLLAGLMMVFAVMAAGVGLVLGWAVASNSDDPAPSPVPAVEVQQPAPAAPEG